MKNADEATTPLEGITVVTEPSAELLNERQQIDYRNQREQCLEWLLVFGKDPKKAEGYAHYRQQPGPPNGSVLPVGTGP
jgi:hypothetical protein